MATDSSSGRSSAASIACQTPGVGDTACPLPWHGNRRADAKTALFEYVAGTPDGANLPHIVRTVFDPDAVDGGADYQVARRFFDGYSELFETARRDGNLWVYPTPAALTLFRSMHAAKPEDGDESGCKTGDGRDEYAKDRARAFLSKHMTAQSDTTRADLLGELATELDTLDDLWRLFERIRDDVPEYLCAPYSTRCNTPSRVADTGDTFDRAWRRATERFDRAVSVTLTTDPKRHDSIVDATASIFEAKNRLLSYLAVDADSGPPRPGYRPPNLTVLEYDDRGKPHLHVVMFGLRFVTTKAALSWYWDERCDHGEVVWFDSLVNRDGRWRWAGDGPDDAGGDTPREYLSKSLRTLSTVAAMSPDDVDDAAAARRSGDPVDAPDDLWKTAIYWALERRLFTGSPSLTHADPDGDDDGRDVPHVARYRFMGVARYADLPGYVRDRAAFLTGRDARGRPPPSTATDAGTPGQRRHRRINQHGHPSRR